MLGAQAVERGQKLQRQAKEVRPNPRDAEDDRGEAFDDGCHLKETSLIESPESRCVFGDPAAENTVVTIGDSHGLMYAPPVIALARQHDWRAINMTRAGCTVAEVEYRSECDDWRENTLSRIEELRPSLVIISNGTDDGDRYAVTADGRQLDRDQSEPYLEQGFAKTLRRIKRTGAKVAVIRDIPHAPDDVLDCVAENPNDLEPCAYRPHRSAERAYDAHAARRVAGVTLIDPLPLICPDGLCPAVIGDALVYRNGYHLSATFAATMAPWLERKLPALPAGGDRNP